jgi:pyruvate kinase
MLSEETAIGRYPVEVVEMISKIATSAERERNFDPYAKQELPYLQIQTRLLDTVLWRR